MSAMMEVEIIDAEERLRLAMLASDVDTLDGLLAPELMFTNHLGQLLRKQDDLAAHRSGMLKLAQLLPSERQVQIHGEVALVSVRMQLSGTYDSQPAQGDFRFTRVWAVASGGGWHIVAAHAVLVN